MVTYVGKQELSDIDESVWSFDLQVAGGKPNDFAAIFFSTDTAVTVSDAAGFTVREQSTTGGDLAAMTRVIVEGDRFFNVTLADLERGVAVMVVYRGAGDFEADAVEGGAGPNHATPSLTPALAGSLVLGAFFRDSASADPVTGVVAAGNSTIRSNTNRSSQGHLVIADVIKGATDATAEQVEADSFPDTGTYGEYVMVVKPRFYSSAAVATSVEEWSS